MMKYSRDNAIMLRLLVFACFFLVTSAGLVRVPKIYNALITSNENLSPSQAYPIVEPVLRTTALGVAFPPIIVHPSTPDVRHKDVKNNKKEKISSEFETIQETTDKTPRKEELLPLLPEFSYHGSLYPLAIDPLFSYSYSSEYLFPSLPFYSYSHPFIVDLGHINEESKKSEKKTTAPPTNFKKNPEIPDVPPPPLPVKDQNNRSTF